MKKNPFTLFAAALVLTLVIVCGSTTWAEEKGWPPPLGKEKIVYLVGPFDTSASVSNIGKILLEKMGYQVELKQLETGLVYEALASGSGDIWSTGYLPGQQPYLNKHQEKLVIVGPSYGPVYDGLVVPSYVPIASIPELNKPEIKEKLKGQIIGIDAGSGTMRTAQKAMEAYELDYELLPGSSPAMEAAFQAAHDKNEWIVVVGWCPTAMCAKFNVKFLKDPKNVFSDAKDFHIVRRAFMDEAPRAVLFLSRLHLYEHESSKVIVDIRASGMEPAQAAQKFIDNNPQLIWWWAGDLIADMKMPESLK